MQWKLSDEQAAYREALRGWLTKVAPVHTVRAWQDEGDGGTTSSRKFSYWSSPHTTTRPGPNSSRASRVARGAAPKSRTRISAPP